MLSYIYPCKRKKNPSYEPKKICPLPPFKKKNPFLGMNLDIQRFKFILRIRLFYGGSRLVARIKFFIGQSSMSFHNPISSYIFLG